MAFDQQTRHGRYGSGSLGPSERSRTGSHGSKIARCYSHALKLACELGLQDEAFERCLLALARLNTLVEAAAHPVHHRGIEPTPRGTPNRLDLHAFGTFQGALRAASLTGAAWSGGKPLELLKILVSFGERPVAEELAIESIYDHISSSTADAAI